MKITEIKIKQIEGFSRLKAVASITLDHQLIINDIKVLESENRCFIEFPRNSFAEFHNIENIVPTSELRKDFENQIMEVFQAMQQIQTDSYEISLDGCNSFTPGLVELLKEI